MYSCSVREAYLKRCDRKNSNYQRIWNCLTGSIVARKQKKIFANGLQEVTFVDPTKNLFGTKI